MRKVELYQGITSSALGFGCAPIMGSVDGATARRALAVALEEGITHFDVARCYGFGQAERLLGECVRQRRQEVVIASKFGIVATAAAAAFRFLKPAVRWMKQKHAPPPHQAAITSKPKATPSLSPANVFLKRVPLQAIAMQRSVETSLRELRTDYLDYLFLHEPLEPITEIESLFTIASQLKQAGKIRAFGLAFMQEQAGLHARYLSRFDLLQMDNSPFAHGYAELVAQRQAMPTIFFSPFRKSMMFPETGFSKSADILKQMQADFPRSVILISMFREEHIRKNAQAFSL